MNDDANAPSKRIDATLRRIVIVMVIVALGFGCHLIYRTSMVVYEIQRSLAAVADTVVDISSQVQDIARDVEQLRHKAEQAVPFDEIDSLFDEVIELRGASKTPAPPLDPKVKAEIKVLLRTILFSGLRFEHSTRQRSASRMYARLYAKHKAYKRTLRSAEDFIDNVATKTVFGNPYYVVLPDGARRPLNDWLTEKLKAHRARKPEPPEDRGEQ